MIKNRAKNPAACPACWKHFFQLPLPSISSLPAVRPQRQRRSAPGQNSPTPPQNSCLWIVGGRWSSLREPMRVRWTTANTDNTNYNKNNNNNNIIIHNLCWPWLRPTELLKAPRTLVVIVQGPFTGQCNWLNCIHLHLIQSADVSKYMQAFHQCINPTPPPPPPPPQNLLGLAPESASA